VAKIYSKQIIVKKLCTKICQLDVKVIFTYVITYILSPAEDALVSAIILLTFMSSRPNFTVTSSYSGPCSGFHHLGHF